MFTIALVIFVILLETFGTPWKPFGAPLNAKWRWRPSCGVTPSSATKTSKLDEAFVKKLKGGPQNSSASTIFFYLKTEGFFNDFACPETAHGQHYFTSP